MSKMDTYKLYCKSVGSVLISEPDRRIRWGLTVACTVVTVSVPAHSLTPASYGLLTISPEAAGYRPRYHSTFGHRPRDLVRL